MGKESGADTDPEGPGRPIRLVAIDVDGTLLARGRDVSPRVKDAIAMTIARGVIVTLATGRMFRYLAEGLARELGLSHPLIVLGGARVVDPTTNQEMYHQGVPLVQVREVIQEARRRGLGVRAYVGDELLVEEMIPDSPSYESRARAGARAVGDLLAYLQNDPTHFAIEAPTGQNRALVRELREVFGAHLNVTTGHPLLVEFSHPAVHKGSALAWLARRLGIGHEEVMAIGDDWNDIDMLRFAGLALAVETAQPEVIAVAHATIPSPEDDGVAWALEKYVLGGSVEER